MNLNTMDKLKLSDFTCSFLFSEHGGCRLQLQTAAHLTTQTLRWLSRVIIQINFIYTAKNKVTKWTLWLNQDEISSGGSDANQIK